MVAMAYPLQQDDEFKMKPSVSRVRRERQRAAATNSAIELAELRSRLAKLETSVTTLSAKLGAMMNASLLQTPPGLQPPSDCSSDAVDRRLRTLEQVFLLTDWAALELAAKKVHEPRVALPRGGVVETLVFDMTLGDVEEHADSGKADFWSSEADIEPRLWDAYIGMDMERKKKV